MNCNSGPNLTSKNDLSVALRSLLVFIPYPSPASGILVFLRPQWVPLDLAGAKLTGAK